jgi:hypothetical protein
MTTKTTTRRASKAELDHLFGKDDARKEFIANVKAARKAKKAAAPVDPLFDAAAAAYSLDARDIPPTIDADAPDAGSNPSPEDCDAAEAEAAFHCPAPMAEPAPQQQAA